MDSQVPVVDFDNCRSIGLVGIDDSFLYFDPLEPSFGSTQDEFQSIFLIYGRYRARKEFVFGFKRISSRDRVLTEQ
jgi:hypothetical protein